MSLLGNIWVKLGLKSDDFNKGLNEAEKKTSKFGNAMKGIAAKVLTVAAAFKVVAGTLKTLANFEASTSKLASVLGKTTADIKGLTQSAIDLGRKTQYTASEVVGLQTELAKLGFTEPQIKSMQESVLKFAAAVGTDLPSAAARAGATMRGFGLTAEETADMLNVMAVSTSKSALSFSYLDSTLGKLVPVTKAYGFDTRDTITLLGTLANAGIDASSAGTALRRVFVELSNGSSKLNQAIGKQPKTMGELIDALEVLKGKNLSVADSANLVGKYAAPAFAALVAGAEDCRQLYGELNNTDGALNDMYHTMTDNVVGAVKELQSAWEGFILNLQNSNGVIARILRGLTNIVNLTNKLAFSETRVGENKSYYDLLWNGKGGDDDYSTMAVQMRFAKERQRLQKEQDDLRKSYEESVKNQGNYAAQRLGPVEETKAWKRLQEQIDGLNQSESEWFQTVIEQADQTTNILGDLGDQAEEDSGSFEELLNKLGKQKEYQKDSIGWLKQEIQAKQELRDEATDTTEIQRYNKEIELLQKKVDLLVKGRRELENQLVVGAISGATYGLKEGEAPGMPTSLPFDPNAVYAWVKSIEDAEEVAQSFGDAIRGGMVGALDELAEAIGTGNWDMSALLKALLNPLADTAISAGVLVSGIGKAIEGFKASLKTLQGPVAIAAGAALIAAGVAVKAGLAALASSGSKAAGSTGGYDGYSYSGGYGVTLPQNTGQMEITVNGVLKGQDIFLASENYQRNKGR